VGERLTAANAFTYGIESPARRTGPLLTGDQLETVTLRRGSHLMNELCHSVDKRVQKYLARKGLGQKYLETFL
jgi:hypothetical protein